MLRATPPCMWGLRRRDAVLYERYPGCHFSLNETLSAMFLNNYENRIDLLIDWIVGEIPVGSRVLDIGAGDGTLCSEAARLARHAGSYEGVDPDAAKLNRHTFLSSRYPSRLEDADIPAESFDCLWANYVFEHVSDEVAFLTAACRILKPGGSLFFITPNGCHYFAVIARALRHVGLQTAILKLVRTPTSVRSHYPALYLLNRPKRLRRLGMLCGFNECEFRYSESLSEFTPYFPGPSKLLPYFWEALVAFTRQDWLLGNLFGRMIRAERDAPPAEIRELVSTKAK